MGCQSTNLRAPFALAESSPGSPETARVFVGLLPRDDLDMALCHPERFGERDTHHFVGGSDGRRADRHFDAIAVQSSDAVSGGTRSHPDIDEDSAGL